ncbi:MAG: hypothetical protein IAG13_26765 [Deltaproteobacteria bacterium]|nr:hypothetical protein [Nannocystaceae bacterium]
MSDDDQSSIARRAATSALPFAELLARNYVEIATDLRDGKDQEALGALGASTDELEHFLAFLVLIQDIVGERDPEGATSVRDYHERILGIIEGLQPALGFADLVEVADTLEDDLVPSLRDYRQLDTTVQMALMAA